ncbi:MAG: mechanosensitive ion channel family protein [Actinomycetia bacterium]|nr:mechanosensitive ion channel family protein [Actinomycetes bacterium]
MAPELLADLEDACGPDPGLVCDAFHGWTGSDNLARLAEWTIEKPATVLIVILIAWLLTRLVRRSIDRFINRLIAERTELGNGGATRDAEARYGPTELLAEKARRRLESMAVARERSAQRATTLGAVLKSVSSSIIWILAFLISLGEFGISLGPLVAGAGIAGIAIGFGAQSLVRDFLAGIFIVIEDQYGVGDVVDVGPATGTIEAVTLRTTRLRDVGGVLWVVPNGEITRVGNMSQVWARTILDIGVSYDTDLGRASAIMKEVADELWAEQIEAATVLEEPEVWGVQDLGDSAVSIRLAVKTDPSEQWAVGRLLRRRIKDRFDSEDIEIPFPQTTVHLDQTSS